MFDVDAYLHELSEKLRAQFSGRLAYIGLQGSYLRGEATEDSDLDIVVLIDGLSPADLASYREIISGMDGFALSCGFICGTDEMKSWNRIEACQLIHTTKDIYGCLQDYLPEWTMEDEKSFVKLSLGNLYHELGHRYVHGGVEKSRQKLPRTRKALFFILQNLHYVETGIFCTTAEELMRHLQGEDQAVFALVQQMREEYNFEQAFAQIFRWCARAMQRF